MQIVGSNLTASDIPELAENTLQNCSISDENPSNSEGSKPIKKSRVVMGKSWVRHGFVMGLEKPGFF